MLKRLVFLSLVVMLIAAACSAPTGAPATPNAAPGGENTAARVVEAYITAKVNVDQEGVRRLLCSEKEKDLQTEATTFLGVTEPKIEGMKCTSIGDNKVKCDGKIVAQYGTETNEFPLVTYRVAQEDGEWKWCGETK